MDAAGKDGTIRHVMAGVNPQGCVVTSFKKPSIEEAEHDFLWRIHKAVPQHGDIGIFNRSQYEDVLVVRVHKLVSKQVWSRRYEEINSFETMYENNVTILKFFLHISKDEQKSRFQQRIDDPDRRWKISQADFDERKFWDDYVAAYEDALTKCSTDHAPWYIIPSNKKWFRNLAVSHIITETMEKMRMKFPPPTVDVTTEMALIPASPLACARSFGTKSRGHTSLTRCGAAHNVMRFCVTRPRTAPFSLKWGLL